MSKGLEALKRFRNYNPYDIEPNLDIIEKELKALEIIRKNLNIEEIMLAVYGVCSKEDVEIVKEVFYE